MRTAAIVLAAAVTAADTAALAQQRPPAEITLVNARNATLVSFEIATTDEQPRLVVRHAKALEPGRSVKLRLGRASGCNFLVLARFSDDSESSDDSMNLCGEREIRLTE